MTTILTGDQNHALVSDSGPDESPPDVSRGPRLTARNLHTAASAGVLAIGVFAIWFLVYGLVLTGIQEHGTQNRLYQKFRVQLAATTATYGGAISNGTPVALLSSKAAGFENLVVVGGTTAIDLAKGPGLQLNTPLPGQAGSSVIFGRSVTYGAPFRNIADLKRGAQISVLTSEGTFVYAVQDIRRAGAPAPAPVTANQSRLTLVTSAGDGWRSGWAPDQVVFVDAALVKGQVQQLTPGLPTSAGSDSAAMQTSTGELPFLVGWIVGLFVAAGLGAWTWRRWGRAQTWLVGVPIFIAVLWGTGNALMRFLPNLI